MQSHHYEKLSDEKMQHCEILSNIATNKVQNFGKYREKTEGEPQTSR